MVFNLRGARASAITLVYILSKEDRPKGERPALEIVFRPFYLHYQSEISGNFLVWECEGRCPWEIHGDMNVSLLKDIFDGGKKTKHYSIWNFFVPEWLDSGVLYSKSVKTSLMIS